MTKVVLITGASSGLGESIAQHLHQRGYIVYGTSRKIEDLKFPFHTLAMDVCNKDSVNQAIQQIINTQGRIDVVINNAGLGLATPFEHAREEEIDRLFSTNIKGVVNVCQSVLPHMRKQGAGKIINISSIGSELGLPYRGFYSASKAALDRLSESMRMEMKKFGIQICVVQPGGIQTDINKNRLSSPIPNDSVYNDSFERTHQIINASVSKGLAVNTFGPAIEKIIEAKTLKRVYRIGKFMEKLSVFLKNNLPASVFEKLIINHYKI